MDSTSRGDLRGRMRVAALALAAVAVLLAGCSDPDEEEFVGAPGVTQRPAEAEPGADPALGVERFLAQLEERTGYSQGGTVETDDDGTTLWVHVDPEHEQWVTDTLASSDLEGLQVVATQPVGGNGSRAADARRYTTAEIAGYRQAVADLLQRLSAELSSGEAEDPDSYPTTASIEVVYGRAGDQLTVVLQARFDRLPAHAVDELRELVPMEVLDLQLDATD